MIIVIVLSFFLQQKLLCRQRNDICSNSHQVVRLVQITNVARYNIVNVNDYVIQTRGQADTRLIGSMMSKLYKKSD